MFDADRPILKSDQDRLGRAQFAKYLARCILDHTSTESLTLGIRGGWGVGKTSIINLMLEELRFAASNMFDDEKPVILNFNPWSYSGQNQLLYSFFRRLSAEIRRADYFEGRDKIIHLLELYISFFTQKPVPKVLRPKHSWFTKIFQKQLVRDETYGWESGQDLTLVKAELNELLGKQKHKLIIVIDNISRLYDEEINQVFQIVKSMGDYANTVYVLAFDEHQIIQVLDSLHGNGRDFLEKIVQLPFDIPLMAKEALEPLLLDRLSKVKRMCPEDSWDERYWADIYYSTLKYFFQNTRDITRYINALSFGFQHVKEVVNPVDFFAITALFVFEPNVYYGIRDNKDLFTDLAENVYESDNEKLREDKERTDEILSRAIHFPPEMLEQLLMRLFPRLRQFYQPEQLFYHSEVIARKNKRICSLDVFDVYFRLTIPSGFISDEEMKTILKLTSDEAGFALLLLRLNQDDRIVKFLDRLDSVYVHQIPTSDVPRVVAALLDSADLFPEGVSHGLSFTTSQKMHRIFHQILMRYEKSHDRFQVLNEAIQKTTKSLYSTVHELREQELEHIENEDTTIPIEYRLFTPLELVQLKKSAVERIMYWVTMNRLAEHPKFLEILHAWYDWDDPHQCKAYLQMVTQDDKGLLALLCAVFKDPIQEAICKENHEIDPRWRNALSLMENLINPQDLVPHAEKLFASEDFEKLRDTEQLSVLIFLSVVDPNAVKIFPKTTV